MSDPTAKPLAPRIPMHLFTRALAVGALLLSGSATRARAQVVSGVLRDADSGAPAPSLYVAVRPQDARRFVGGAQTDSAGRFTAAVPAAGLYHVEISLPDGIRLPVDSLEATPVAEPPRALTVPLTDAERRHMYYDFEVDRPATVLHGVRPSYPEEARVRRTTGEVVVQVAVDSTGVPVPETLRVLSSPGPAFVDAVREAMATTTFTPAVRKGRPVRQLVQWSFVFTLD